MDKVIHLGIDVGSTTVKIVALNDQLKLVFSDYQRHYADIKETVISMMRAAYTRFPESKITIMFTGSGGIASPRACGFTQEVIASSTIERFISDRR